MTEQEIIERQQENENKEFYLIRQGIFYNAYEGGAYALHRLTGYQLRRKHGKTDGPVTAGFNLSAATPIDVVIFVSQLQRKLAQ